MILIFAMIKPLRFDLRHSKIEGICLLRKFFSLFCTGLLALSTSTAWADAPASATVIDKAIGLRVTEEQERVGLDISLHGESV